MSGSGSCARCDTTVRKSGSTEEPQGWKRRISVPLERSRAIAENYCLATKDRIDVASSDKSDYLRYGLRRKYVCALLPRRSQSPLIELLCECSTRGSLVTAPYGKYGSLGLRPSGDLEHRSRQVSSTVADLPRSRRAWTSSLGVGKIFNGKRSRSAELGSPVCALR